MKTRVRAGQLSRGAIGVALALGGAITASAPVNAVELNTLPLSGFDDIVLDETNGHLFFSQGLDAGGVLVTDLDGTTVTELSGLTDSRRLALSFDDATLWVTLPRAGQVVGIDTATLAESARFTLPTGVCPGSVTEVDGYLAVGHSCNQWARNGSYGGVGVLDPATGAWEPLTFSGPFYRPIVAASPGSQDLFVTGDIGISPTTLFTVTAIDGIPDLVTSRRSTGSYLRDLAMSPDGTTVVQAAGSPSAHPSFTVPFLQDSTSYDSSTLPNAATWSDDGTTVFTGTSTQYGIGVRAHAAGSPSAVRTYEFGSQKLADSGLVSTVDGVTAYAVTSEPSGPWRLHALRLPTTTTLDLTGPASTFAGEPLTLSGTLTAADGRPMGGRAVSFVRQGTGVAPVSIGSRTTAADGSFELTNYPFDPGPTTYRATYAGDGTEGSSTASFTLDVLRKAVSTIIVDAPSSVAEGESIDLTGTLSFDDGRPAGGRDIDLYVDSPTQYNDPVATATTDATGSFAFSYPPATPGQHYFSMSYAGDVETEGAFQTAAVDVVADTVSTLTIDVPATVELDQLVQVDGQLAISDGVIEPNLYVWLYGQTAAGNYVWTAYTTTDASGGFSEAFIASVAGPITITAEFDGAAQYTPSTATATIDVVAPPEPTATSLTINGPPNATVGSSVRLWGQLVDDAGTPLAGRDITIGEVAGHGFFDTVTTNPNGVWEVDVVMSAEDYVVYDAAFAGDAEYAASNASIFIEIDATETTLTVSGPSTASVGDGVTLSGFLREVTGAGVQGGVSISRSGGGDATYLATVATASDGSFGYVDIPPGAGSYTYTVSFNGSASHAAASDTHGVAVALRPSTAVIGAPATAVVGDSIPINASLTENGQSPISGRSVQIVRVDDDGQTSLGSFITDATGSISTTDTADTAGLHTYRISFGGDATFAGSQAETTVQVTAVATTMTLTATEVAGRKNRGKFDLSAVLTPSGGRTIQLYARTDGGSDVLIASGPSALTLRVDPSKTTTYTARFDGDGTALASSDSVTITVKPKGGGKPPK